MKFAHGDVHQDRVGGGARRGAALWILVLLATTLAVACSSDTEELTLDEWARVACDSQATLASLPAPDDLGDFAAVERVTDAIDQAAADLDEIEPPAVARDYHGAVVVLYRGISSAQRAFLDEATNGDAAAVDAATTEYQAELQRVFGAFDPDLVTAEIEQALLDTGCDS
jgi:hypothetical protein